MGVRSEPELRTHPTSLMSRDHGNRSGFAPSFSFFRAPFFFSVRKNLSWIPRSPVLASERLSRGRKTGVGRNVNDQVTSSLWLWKKRHFRDAEGLGEVLLGLEGKNTLPRDEVGWEILDHVWGSIEPQEDLLYQSKCPPICNWCLTERSTKFYERMIGHFSWWLWKKRHFRDAEGFGKVLLGLGGKNTLPRNEVAWEILEHVWESSQPQEDLLWQSKWPPQFVIDAWRRLSDRQNLIFFFFIYSSQTPVAVSGANCGVVWWWG